MIRCLGLALFGRSVVLDDLAADRSIWGGGLGDWDGYARQLARLFTYANTFPESEPRLDIAAPPKDLFGKLDFLIAADAFENFSLSLDRALRGAFELLKPGGVLVATVPRGRVGDWRLRLAGFERIELHDQDDPAPGIIRRGVRNAPLTAFRPGPMRVRRPRYRARWRAFANLRASFGGSLQC